MLHPKLIYIATWFGLHLGVPLLVAVLYDLVKHLLSRRRENQ